LGIPRKERGGYLKRKRNGRKNGKNPSIGRAARFGKKNSCPGTGKRGVKQEPTALAPLLLDGKKEKGGPTLIFEKRGGGTNSGTNRPRGGIR